MPDFSPNLSDTNLFVPAAKLKNHWNNLQMLTPNKIMIKFQVTIKQNKRQVNRKHLKLIVAWKQKKKTFPQSKITQSS